jgi:hypothetical protein
MLRSSKMTVRGLFDKLNVNSHHHGFQHDNPGDEISTQSTGTILTYISHITPSFLRFAQGRLLMSRGHLLSLRARVKRKGRFMWRGKDTRNYHQENGSNIYWPGVNVISTIKYIHNNIQIGLPGTSGKPTI